MGEIFPQKSAEDMLKPPTLYESLFGGVTVKQGYRLIVVDKDGVLVSEFQLRESDLADPAAFVGAIRQSIEDIEDEEP